MHTFVDNANRTWEITINVAVIKRVRGLLDVDLNSLVETQRIADEAGLLACSMYVDLNPVRAAMASTPEQSVHTSAYDRIQALQGEKIDSAAAELAVIETEEAGRKIQAEQWGHTIVLPN
jgi:hypothetical protein